MMQGRGTVIIHPRLLWTSPLTFLGLSDGHYSKYKRQGLRWIAIQMGPSISNVGDEHIHK